MPVSWAAGSVWGVTRGLLDHAGGSGGGGDGCGGAGVVVGVAAVTGRVVEGAVGVPASAGGRERRPGGGWNGSCSRPAPARQGQQGEDDPDWSHGDLPFSVRLRVCLAPDTVLPGSCVKDRSAPGRSHGQVQPTQWSRASPAPPLVGRAAPRGCSAGVDRQGLLDLMHGAAGHGQGEVVRVGRAAHQAGVAGQLGELMVAGRLAVTAAQVQAQVAGQR
jgi:hypothetical protein